MSQPLPIDAIKSDFLQAINQHPLILLSAPPGAGKSTGLPLWLMELDKYKNKKIYLLQPRRVAAKNIAIYLAKQLGEQVGQRVGYRLRNDTKVGSNTILEVVTEGVLTQIIQQDPEMETCAMVILDEFHERSVHAELAFALCRDIQLSLREDLVLVLMSATLSQQALQQQLPEAVHLISEGRSYPVEVSYQPPKQASLWREHALTVISQTINSHAGSVLVFLPGVADILFIKERLEAQLPENKVLAPLYGDLPLDKQQLAIAPPPAGVDKIVLTTNIAETSLTIEGVNLVIDAGLEKVSQFDQQSLTNVLVQQQTARSSCVQRAGRAGRLMAGKCIRLFSQDNFERRAESSNPEILQTDVLPVVIEAARWGVTELSDLPLLQSPSANTAEASWLQAKQLGLVDEKRRLTQHGEQVSALSCHPRFAHMVLTAKDISKKFQIEGLLELSCLIAAMLEEKDIFASSGNNEQSDIKLRVNLLAKANSNSYLNKRILQQANKFLKQTSDNKFSALKAKDVDRLPIQYCGELIAIAYPERLAKIRNSEHLYIAANGKGLALDEADNLCQSEYIAVARVRLNKYNKNLQVLLAASVDIDLLELWQIVQIEQKDVLIYDASKNKIRGLAQTCLGDLVLKEQNNPAAITPDKVTNLWIEQVKEHGINWLNWQSADIALKGRWQWLSQHDLTIDLPKLNEQALLDNLDSWFAPFVGSVMSKADLDKISISEMLWSMLDYQQQQLFNKLVPYEYTSPSGRKYKIDYTEELNPKISIPMQELYGEKASPALGQGQQAVALTLELLSPARRPIQLTQDLAGFWQGSYKDVQKEMKSRYPKHYWPDDPANAEPTLKTKKQMK